MPRIVACAVTHRTAPALVAGALAALAACAAGPRRPTATRLEAGASAAPAAVSSSAVDSKLAEGARLYKAKGCIMCHGEGAKGGVVNRYSQSELIPALEKVAEGYSEDELREKIRKGVPAVARKDANGHAAILIMPSWEDKLTGEELDAIVAYLFSLAPQDAEGGSDDF